MDFFFFLFLKMYGERIWNIVEKGWEAPLKLDVTGRSTSELKPKQEWDKLDKIETNTQTLFSIFNRVNPDEFNRIVTCKRAKKA